MRALLFSLVIFLLSFSNVEAQLASEGWPMFKGNAKHTGQTDVDIDIEKPHIKWKFDAKDGVEVNPAVANDGTIYFGTFRDNFYALNHDGTEKWRIVKKDEGMSSSPAIAEDGTVYFMSVGNMRPVYNALHKIDFDFGVPRLYAATPDGEIKWEFDLGGIYSGTITPPTIGKDGTIYIGSGGSKMQPDVKTGDFLWAINPDGTEKWRFNTGDAIFSSPAIADDGTIYVAAANYNIFALNPDGTEKWRFGSSGSFDCSPAIGRDGTIYVGSTDEYLYALAPNGNMKWKFKVGDILEASPSIGPDGTIYVGVIDMTMKDDGGDNNLYALNPDGTEKWRFETGGGVYATPIVEQDGTIYFGSYDGNLYSLNPDGTENWRFKTEAGIVGPPAVSDDGVIYVGSWDNYLYAIDGKRTTLLERITLLFEKISTNISTKLSKYSRYTVEQCEADGNVVKEEICGGELEPIGKIKGAGFLNKVLCCKPPYVEAQSGL